jgi:predicted DNA-binding ribbon-helix-helix protein
MGIPAQKRPDAEGASMCNLFKTQDPETYRAETRPIRLHGHLTSLRLESAFWSILREIADHEAMSLSQFLTVLYDEVLERQGEVANFASYLRVTCLKYLRNVEQYDAQLLGGERIHEMVAST